MRALLLLALLVIPACSATTDQIAQLYGDKLNEKVPYIDVLETDCQIVGGDLALSATIGNVSYSNIFQAVLGAVVTYDSVNTSKKLRVHIADPSNRTIGSATYYREWEEEFNQNRSNEAWTKEMERVRSTTRIYSPTNYEIAQLYAQELNNITPYIDLLETSCFYINDDIALSAIIGNVTAENIYLPIWGAVATYTNVNTPCNLRIYINDPAEELIGAAVCNREWTDEFNQNRSSEAWTRMITKVRSTTIMRNTNTSALEVQKAPSAAALEANPISTKNTDGSASPSATSNSAVKLNLTPNSRGYIDVSSLDSYFFK